MINDRKLNFSLLFTMGLYIFFFFFYEWEHRTGTMCPFSSLYPSRNGKE